MSAEGITSSDEAGAAPAPGGGALHKRPVAEVWTLAWPTVLTMTSYTVMQFIDKIMVAQVGPLEVAAQGNGAIWSFNPIVFGLGVLTVVNTFVSQNLGAGRPQEGPKYAWAGLWLGVTMWLLFLLPMAALAPYIFTAMESHSEELRRMETGYCQILLLGGLALLMSRAMHHYFFGLHRPKIITLAAIVGNLVNVCMNYVFIYGVDSLGIPAMGVYGAAIGTVIGTFCELLIPLAIFLGPKMNRELRTRAPWRPAWKPVRDLLRIGWPAGVQFGNEIICWSLFMTVLVGKFGENHLTAGWAVLGYMHLSFMPAIGFSTAVSSLVGRYIGAGQPDIAAHRARVGLVMSVLYMTMCGAVMYLFREPLVAVFASGGDTSAEVTARIVQIGAALMICAAIFQTFDAAGMVYSGALRGAGDTVWPGVAVIICSWLFIVLGGWLLTEYWPEIESIGPWLGAAAYIIVLGVLLAWRFESGAWRRIKLVDRHAAEVDIKAREELLEREAAKVAPSMPGLPPPDGVSSVRDFAESEGDAVEAERALSEPRR